VSTHAEAIADRLPVLYRDGELLRGVLDALGLQLEIVDEEGRQVQRTHWIGTVNELSEAGMLGALLDIAPEPWQALGEYLAWFHALRTARLREGGVTGQALRTFVRLYAEAFEATNHVEALPSFDKWSPKPAPTGHCFVENPARPEYARLGGATGAEPLTRQVVVNGGLDPAPLSILITGLGSGPEYVPVVANLTTGDGLVFLGTVPVGARLWISATADGVQAALGRDDATNRLRYVSRVVPGQPWGAADIAAVPAGLRLALGANDLWFLPVAHFDHPGLDRALLALADLELEQGRWDQSRFDHALFAQEPAVGVDLVWVESTPASVRIDLDGAALLTLSGQLDEGFEARDQLESSLRQGVQSLAAAGVATEVRLRPLTSSQRQRDHLVLIMPLWVTEAGATGADRLPDSGGAFDVTNFDNSTYR
jgi:hypothetical protein